MDDRRHTIKELSSLRQALLVIYQRERWDELPQLQQRYQRCFPLPRESGHAQHNGDCERHLRQQISRLYRQILMQSIFDPVSQLAAL